MADTKEYKHSQGNRWVSKVQFPEKRGDVIHVWKIVSPMTDTGGLFREYDAYRKRINDSMFFQLNIDSEIKGDTNSIRSGQIFIIEKGENTIMLKEDLNEQQLDSIFRKWELYFLVRQ